MDREEIAKKSIENLKRYIKEDLIYQENKPESDFDQFCIDHCKDIKIALGLIETLQRDKNMVLEKLEKIINGLESDFAITLGEQQPLWEENKTKYVSKDKIRNKIKEKQDRIDKMNPIGDCVLIDDLETEIQALEELIEEN